VQQDKQKNLYAYSTKKAIVILYRYIAIRLYLVNTHWNQYRQRHVMNRILPLKNTIQEYAWGSRTAIAGLLGHSPAKTPQAELWMGAHPRSPSLALNNERWEPLTDLIRQYPEDILGKSVAEKFDHSLPYLFKILAAETPLSIQAHPNAEQARRGFDRENRLNIPIDAPFRSYRDANHKPECICALEPFHALCGFRSVSDIVSELTGICPKALGKELNDLKHCRNSNGLKFFFEGLMTLPRNRKTDVIHESVESAAFHKGNPVHNWILRLHEAYPVDIGILAPAYLNLVELNPGEALFLPSGRLHAYLKGVGIELMANSDNVLRGGLTPKHVDVPELLNVLEFEEAQPDILLPEPIRPCEMRYPKAAAEFYLSDITVTHSETYTAPQQRNVELVICVKGRVCLSDSAGRRNRLDQGQSALIPAALEWYTVEGSGKLYKAGVMPA